MSEPGVELIQELQNVKERNKRVEADKAWETSLFRRMLIAAITYVIAAVVMYAIGVANFYLSALIPTLGFLLSTLTLPAIKRWWIRNHFQK